MTIRSIVFGLAAVAANLVMLSGAQAAVFTGTFSGASEIPGNASSGTGEVVVTVDDALQTMLVEITFSGLTGAVTAAHLHCCGGPGVNSPVASPTPTFPGFPTGVTSGSYSMSFDLTEASTFSASFITNNGGTVAGAAALLIASLAEGLVYANIHTTVFPGGEIRADLSPESTVPLPAALWMFIAGGLSLAGAAARRRQAA